MKKQPIWKIILVIIIAVLLIKFVKNYGDKVAEETAQRTVERIMKIKTKIRHPEKVNKPVNPIKKKPDWIRSKLSNSKEFFLTKTIINQNNLSYCLPRSKLSKYY